MMSLVMRWLSPLRGRQVGTDEFGNRYFEGRATRAGHGPSRRWVVYPGVAEATAVPPEWHGWLHHTTEAPLDPARRHPWQIGHQPNATGTAAAYRPLGHDYAGGQRAPTAGDYEAWTPGR